MPFCRLKKGEIWEDPEGRHRIGALDATDKGEIQRLFAGDKAALFIHDPPYNVRVGGRNTRALSKDALDNYLSFTSSWVENALEGADDSAHFYLWMGADWREGFQPLPDVMVLLRSFEALKSRNFITLRNQRGYGTAKNWMWVRQELLHYTVGNPEFQVVYTGIPKILKGYYKTVGGERTENLERSLSDCIRPGNVWVDIQQVFYRREENVPGCYAQKPLNAIERLVETSSRKGELVADFFAHSGTTLIAAERLGRRSVTLDLDPLYAEIAIRRLERFRATGKTGWQFQNPFPELENKA